ncbi:hypothetical protein [Sphingosinicella soli]|uniref:Uncharacterized protein n=1 Tax=Sphingosinicella soli TaxID=333708 RepID=A0A7W7B4V0_9SPHN|nr:hypothetical protein [Sphingosinicella soli]MBB4633135.1 hypothetical protein [Sphingosinicella soli]
MSPALWQAPAQEGDPATAKAIGQGMGAYLEAIPEPLYMLFGTGYLGYTAARSWGKAKGADK